MCYFRNVFLILHKISNIMVIKRDYTTELNELKKGFPIIALTGARQVGKTTFLKEQFPEYEYYNLETPSTLSMIERDPETFLRNKSHIILDEVQKCPLIFSCLLEIVDDRKIMADFILSGSENLLLSEKISQSLAGRAGYLRMNPFSFQELQNQNLLSDDFCEQIFKGFLPTIYDRAMSPIKYYDQYIATYLERDVRQIKNVQNLDTFRKFVSLLAGRIGQMINYQSLVNDIWIDEKTVKSWISILEASFLVFKLYPYYENFGKRYIKSPKIYFMDTGLACRLLRINSVEELRNNTMIGNLFENMIVAEIKKQLNILWYGEECYFYRDSHQKEVDIIIDKANTQIPIEIKSSGTYSKDFEKGISYWKELNKNNQKKQPEKWWIIYTGKSIDLWDINVINWKDFRYYHKDW